MHQSFKFVCRNNLVHLGQYFSRKYRKFILKCNLAHVCCEIGNYHSLNARIILEFKRTRQCTIKLAQ